jgi:excisionase family DNA binding protein
MEDTSLFLTPEEVAEILRVKVGTLHNWRQRDVGPPAVRMGKYLRYRRSSFDKWLSEIADGTIGGTTKQTIAGPAPVPGQRRLKGVD